MSNRRRDTVREGENDVPRANLPGLGACLDRLHMEVKTRQVAGFVDASGQKTVSRAYHCGATRAIGQRRNQALIWKSTPVQGTPPQAVIEGSSPHEELLDRVPGILDRRVSHSLPVSQLGRLGEPLGICLMDTSHRLMKLFVGALHSSRRIHDIEQQSLGGMKHDQIIIKRVASTA
jgi:hypothetical protein